MIIAVYSTIALVVFFLQLLLFIHLLEKNQARSGRTRGVELILLGLPLAATWAVLAGTCGFLTGLVIISPTLISFDTQSIMWGCFFGTIFFFFAALLQLLVMALMTKYKKPYWMQVCMILLPVLGGALLLGGWGAWSALPENRFEGYLGIEPPASVANIHYTRVTHGLFSSSKLTCRINPEDAETVLNLDLRYHMMTYDPTNQVLTVGYAAD